MLFNPQIENSVTEHKKQLLSLPRQRIYTFLEEPTFCEPTAIRLKCHIVAYGIDHALGTIAQFDSDQFDLQTAHTNKIIKYEVLLTQHEFSSNFRLRYTLINIHADYILGSSELFKTLTCS